MAAPSMGPAFVLAHAQQEECLLPVLESKRLKPHCGWADLDRTREAVN